MRTGHWLRPDGSKQFLATVNERRRAFNFYFPRYVRPWFESFIDPYQVEALHFYARGMMLYWGAVVSHGRP